MTENQVAGHTKNPEAPSYPRKWILRGLSADIDPNDIIDDIRDSHGLTVEVTAMTQRKKNGEPSDREPSALFTVVAATSDEARRMGDISIVFHHRVTWEVPEKIDITQCYRCQKWGHSSKYCNYERRCVKCSHSHERGQCTNNDAQSEVYCVNCKATGHPSSWKGCPARLRIVEANRRARQIKLAEAKQMVNQAGRLPNTFRSARTQPGVSFSAALGGSRFSPSVIQGTGTNDIMGLSVLQLCSRIETEIERFKRSGGVLANKQERDALIITILASIQIEAALK